jgi:AcrR family transcriptional regulator
VPRLWTQTIAEHRAAVTEAVLETAASLVAHHGLRGVTMSRIAELSGIGRATLYKYFPDVESILGAWHQRQVDQHFERLAAARDRADGPMDRLLAVLHEYASIIQAVRRHGDPALAATLHRAGRLGDAERRLRAMLLELIRQAASEGHVRADVPAGRLADYCLAALSATAGSPSAADRDRLVEVIVSGLRPGPPTS